ncbi:MAG TPA: efflux RND transporter periplasmic adaptor subunit [Steroidobacteraceae bacterium]|nr:efflux RND transporter periplasmic adaptor subunit [Steroidobacteraceae bacterium]
MNTDHIALGSTRSGIAGSLLVLAFAAHAAAPPQQPAAPVAVEVTQPTRGSVQRWVTLPGSIRPMQEATLYAKVPGYLKSISVDKGDAVKAGATLAVLETPELTADLARNQAEHDAARSEFTRIEQAIARAPDLITPLELDRARGKYEVAKASLERTQTLLSFNRITAPFAGVVTRRFVDVGAFIPAATSGSAAQNAAVLTLMDFSTVRVQVAVPEAEAALATKGQPARVTVEGLPGRRFEGRISRTSYALDDATRTMLVEVDIPNRGLELRPGMYASVQLALQRHDDVLLIPAAALVMEKANAFAWTVEGGVAKKRAIQIGFNDGQVVEVREGLDAGRSIILPGKRALTDGMPVLASTAPAEPR